MGKTEYIRVSAQEIGSIGTDQTGKCWWCGSVADSREHKVKKSVLKQMWTEDGLDLLPDWSLQDKYTLKSAGSKAVMFSRIICRRCNDTRSQPFDTAYDRYWAFIDENVDTLTTAMCISLPKVYGSEWKAKSQNLGRYALKLLGCRLAEQGTKPPQTWIDFLNGGALLDTRIRLGRWEYMSLISQAFRNSRGTSLNCGAGHRGAAWWVNSTKDALTHFEAVDFVNDIMTHVSWSIGSGAGEVFWGWEDTPLEIERATDQERAHAKEVAARLSKAR